jgi:hypothetical protein
VNVRRLFRGGSAAALAFAIFVASKGVAAEDGGVRIEIDRPESNGLMNLVPCIIEIVGDAKGAVCHEVRHLGGSQTPSHGGRSVLLGGDRVTCKLGPSNSIQAFTPRAMRPPGYAVGARSSWRATTWTPRARPGETVDLVLVPKSRGSTYAGGWLLHRRDQAAAPESE